MERVMKEIRRRTRFIGEFTDGSSAGFLTVYIDTGTLSRKLGRLGADKCISRTLNTG
jgi:hypothetical protein